MHLFKTGAALAIGASVANAISIDIQDPSSIKSVASALAFNMVSYYAGNKTGGIPGILGGQYYWWETGAMMGTLIDYWYYTGDETYNDLTSQALLFQTGPDFDYMPPNQTKNEGNDDQIFWAFSVMSAAEYKFPNPPAGQPQWLALAEAVFNSQAHRWDADTCGGGIRWQIFTWNNGFDYKSTPSNAGLLNLAARLYAYTGNESYSDFVYQEWDWLNSVKLITPQFNAFDGIQTYNCSLMDQVQWTYSYGMLINAAAIMQNLTTSTNQTLWQQRANGFWKMSESIFFNNSVLYESACEPHANCDTDQLTFKSFFARFLAASTKWMPSLTSQFQPYFAASAVAAAAQCDGPGGIVCGFDWTQGAAYDGTAGVGQQMSAIQIVMANLIGSASYPVTAARGGISTGNTSLGNGGDDMANPAAVVLSPITTSDRAGAGILTTLVLAGTMGGVWWIVAS